MTGSRQTEYPVRHGRCSLDEGLGHDDGVTDALLDVLSRLLDRSSWSDDLAAFVTDGRMKYHLSRQRAHLLRPLQIGAGQRVLEVGAGTGSLTRYLGEQGARVTALEPTLPRARAAAARCDGLENVEVVCGTLAALALDEPFDLVICCGAFDPAERLEQGPLAFLERLRSATAPAGALVVTIENQLGLKHLVDHCQEPLDGSRAGAKPYPRSPGSRTSSRVGLRRLLAAHGFPNQRWLYPYPDHKLPRVVLSDRAFDRDDHLDFVDQLVRWPCPPEASTPARVANDRASHRTFLEAGLGREVANSFLVVAGGPGAPLDEITPPDVLAWHLGSERRSGLMRAKVFRLSVTGVDVWSQDPPAPAPSMAAWLTHAITPHSFFEPGRTVEQVALEAAAVSIDALAGVLEAWREHLRGEETGPRMDGLAPHPFRPEGVARLLPDDHLDVNLSNFVTNAEGGFRMIDTEWRAAGGVGADMACLRALWWFARDLVIRAHPHPWPPTCPVREVASELARLCGVPAGAADLDRMLRAEAELHAEIHGGAVSQFLSSLESEDALSRSGAEAILDLPFTARRPEPADDARDRELAHLRAHRAAFEQRLLVRAYRRVKRLFAR